jgi:hypothetical protein
LKRRTKEAQVVPAPGAPVDAWNDLREVLDVELERLPEKYRTVIVLSDLEGATGKEVAQRLGVPEGTVMSRLARGRALLAKRLTRHGLALPGAALGLALSWNTVPAAVPPELLASTVGAASVWTASKAVVGLLSARVAALTEGVLKAMLLDKLKTTLVVILLLGAVTLTCGVLARERGNAGFEDGPGGTPARPAREAQADRGKDQRSSTVSDAEVQALVKQLGADGFADREAAEKRLRELGVKALPAIKAAMADPDLEVARRSARIRAAITRDRLWAAFARVAGNDRAARNLFAEIMRSPRAVAAIEAALDDPRRTDELYRNRTAELMRIAEGHPPVAANGKPDVPDKPGVWGARVPLGDVVGWQFLGSLQSGTAAWAPVTHREWQHRLSSHLPFLPEDDYTSAKPIEAAYEGAMGVPFKKLTTAWLLRRRENDGLRAGLTLAIRYDIPEAVAVARNVLKQPQSAEIEAQNLAAAMVLLGLYGGKDDLPLLARHAANKEVFLSILDSSVKVGPFRLPEVKDGRDLTCQVRDVVAATMCKLAGRDPADFGFPAFPRVKHPNGRPRSLGSSTAAGFKSETARPCEQVKCSWLWRRACGS